MINEPVDWAVPPSNLYVYGALPPVAEANMVPLFPKHEGWVTVYVADKSAKAARVVDVDGLHISWSGPATACGGGLLNVTVTSLEELVHVPLLIVQRKVYDFPVSAPAAEVVALCGDSITNGSPKVCVQVPVPTTGALPISAIGSMVQYEVLVAEASAVVGEA